MKRTDLAATLRSRFPDLEAADVMSGIAEILKAMMAALACGERIEIRGFGSFDLNYRQPRASRNPKTGEPVAVPAKYAPHFKPGKELRKRVGASS